MSRSKLVLVVGPPLAGVDGVIGALRARLSGHVVVGADGLGPQCAPDAVVAVVSAVAPMTGSDWDLIVRAAARTDLVIGAVSKIDAHRNWRDVLEADRAFGADGDPRRQSMPWVGVAAAPDLGESNVSDLVEMLTDGLADPALDQRNRLRRNDYRVTPSRQPGSTGGPREAVESRVALQRVRLRLLRFVRDGCTSMRTELRDAASSIPAGGTGRFESRVRDDVARFVAELDDEITRAVNEYAPDQVAVARPMAVDDLTPPHVEAAPSASRRLETRLMAVLGLGFGLGIALASSRLLSGLAPGLSITGWVAGAAVGSALVGWMVRTRGVLHDRALLDRWVSDVAANLRWHGEAMVADRLLAVEVGVKPRKSGF